MTNTILHYAFSSLGDAHNAASPLINRLYNATKLIDEKLHSERLSRVYEVLGATKYNYPIAKFCFYGAFILSTSLSYHLASLACGNGLALLVPMIIGAVLQGRPDCLAQKVIEKKKDVAAFAGMLNGLMCCGAHSLLLSAPNFIAKTFLGMPQVNAAFYYTYAAAVTIGFVVLASEGMCKFEKWVAEFYGIKVKEPQKSACCCNGPKM
jgi:hypothetical protein